MKRLSSTTVRLLIVATVVFAPLLALTPVRAATTDNGDSSFNLTSSPLAINLIARPGTTVTTPLRVQNTGNNDVTINVSLSKFGAYGTGGMPSIQDPSPNDDFIKWASFSKTRFVAEPGVWNDITMTIKVPKTAAFGYYYAVVFSTDQQKPQFTDGRRTGVNGAVASLVLLNATAPGEKRELKIEDFVSIKKIYEYAPASFDVKVKNVGNVHAIPSGNISISRTPNSEILSTISINSQQGNVLPNSKRVFSATWDDGWPVYKDKRINDQVISDNNGKPIKELDWSSSNFGKFRIGKYTATMTLVYNDGTYDIPVEGTVSFWIIPWKLLGIALIIIALVLFAVYMIGRQTIRKVKHVTRKKDVE